MVELALLALLNRLMSWGCAPVIATRVIAADAAALRAIVADPNGQWRLVAGVSRFLRPHASVVASASSRLVPVRVQLGRRDVLWITWILTPRRGTTEVDLAAQIESRGLFARLALVVGGRRWLRYRLDATLNTLATVAHCAAEDLDDVERDAEFHGVVRSVTGG
jgi:small-conductance mechanosensitive channel